MTEDKRLDELEGAVYAMLHLLSSVLIHLAVDSPGTKETLIKICENLSKEVDASGGDISPEAYKHFRENLDSFLEEFRKI